MAYQKTKKTVVFQWFSFCFESIKPIGCRKCNHNRISSSLTYEILDRLILANAIMIDEKMIIGDQYLRYKLE